MAIIWHQIAQGWIAIAAEKTLTISRLIDPDEHGFRFHTARINGELVGQIGGGDPAQKTPLQSAMLLTELCLRGKPLAEIRRAMEAGG